ncbi:MAG: transcriptional regulator, partial [Chloroflexota bacterium]
PPLDVAIDVQETQGKKVIRITVPRGDDPPYAIEDNRIYLRDEAETTLAVRDEIVQLVKRGLGLAPPQPALEPIAPATPGSEAPLPPHTETVVSPPRTGVEIVDSEEREGVIYHTVCDLRNGNIVKNVTRKSARRLWHYAITQHETHPVDESKVTWHGDLGLLGISQRAGKTRYDLVQRINGKLRVYYGVTEDGIHGEWKRVVGASTEEE